MNSEPLPETLVVLEDMLNLDGVNGGGSKTDGRTAN